MFEIKNPNKFAAIDLDEKIKVKYKDLLKISNCKIFKSNSIFLILSTNSIGCLASYFGAIQNKNLIILNKEITIYNEIVKIINDFKPQYVVAPNYITSLHGKENLVLIKKIFNYFIYKNKNKSGKYNKKIKLLLSTSGTEGEFKWVKISEKNLKDNIYKISKKIRINSNDTTITTLPFEYSYGLSIINTHLLNNAKIILTKQNFFNRNFWVNLKKTKVNNFGGVPFSYEILNKLNFEKLIKDSSLKYLTQAGGKLDSDLHKEIYKKLNNLNIKFHTMYGATEAGPRITINLDNGKRNNYETVGKPLENYRLIIKKNKKIIKETMIIGNLYLNSKSLFGGYAKNQKQLNHFKKLKELNLGDIGYFDKEGNFYVTGRSKRVGKIKGVRLDLELIEKILKKRFKKNFAVKSNDKKIFIFYEGKRQIKKQSINELVRIHPSDIILKRLNILPINSRGKIDHMRLDLNS